MSELDRLFDITQDGFKRTDRSLENINEHLSKLNGKVASHEAKHVAYETKMSSLYREVDTLKSSCPLMAGNHKPSQGLTWQDIRKIGLAFAFAATVVEGLHQLGIAMTKWFVVR